SRQAKRPMLLPKTSGSIGTLCKNTPPDNSKVRCDDVKMKRTDGLASSRRLDDVTMLVRATGREELARLRLNAQPALQAIDKLRQSQHCLLFGDIVRTAQPVIRPPVHSFRPVGEHL